MPKPFLCAVSCVLAACAVSPADEAAVETAPVPPPPSCLRSLTAVRVSTVHHLAVIGGVTTGGLINQAQWFPSAANQALDVAVPLDSGVELDALTVSSINAAHAHLVLYRIDAPVADPTFLGAFTLASVIGSATTWTLIRPQQIDHDVEVGSTSPAAYYIHIVADTGGEGFGPVSATTSVLSVAPTPTPAGDC